MLLPLLRPSAKAALPRADYEINVYRDQLAGIEDEVAHGLITQTQADAARLEIHRRMLGAADHQDTVAAPENRRTNSMLAILIALALPLGSWLLYAGLGSPQLPDRPFAARQNDADMKMNSTADIIAAELEANPDARGYKQLAEMYYILRRFDRAAEACRKAIDLGADDAETWSRLGESLVMENDGAVVMDAQKAFKEALARDKTEPHARFYIGLAEAQIGELKKAVAIWRDLEKAAPPDAPWMPMIKESIALYAKEGGFNPASIAPAPVR